MLDILWTAFGMKLFKIWLSIFSQHRSFSDDKSSNYVKESFYGRNYYAKTIDRT